MNGLIAIINFEHHTQNTFLYLKKSTELLTNRLLSHFFSSSLLLFLQDMDVDSILDYDMKRMGEPDGAESGVMIDMEGSLPVFSESGDLTPEPTRVTPQEKTPRRHKRDKHF